MDIAIKVVVKRVGELPEVKVINNNTETLQELVGGLFDMVRVPFRDDMLYMVCNDVGKIIGLPMNFYEPARNDVIVGDVFFTAGNFEGDLIDLTNEQIRFIKSYLELQTLW